MTKICGSNLQSHHIHISAFCRAVFPSYFLRCILNAQGSKFGQKSCGNFITLGLRKHGGVHVDGLGLATFPPKMPSFNEKSTLTEEPKDFAVVEQWKKNLVV